MKMTKGKSWNWRLCGLLSIFLVFGLALPVYAGTGQDLIAAAKNGNIAKVKALLAKGADVNVKNNNGNTALDAAKASGHTEIVQLLIKAGAKE